MDALIQKHVTKGLTMIQLLQQLELLATDELLAAAKAITVKLQATASHSHLGQLFNSLAAHFGLSVTAPGLPVAPVAEAAKPVPAAVVEAPKPVATVAPVVEAAVPASPAHA